MLTGEVENDSRAIHLKEESNGVASANDLQTVMKTEFSCLRLTASCSILIRGDESGFMTNCVKMLSSSELRSERWSGWSIQPLIHV